MMISRPILGVTGVGLALAMLFSVATAKPAKSTGDAVRGRQLFATIGCYQCHGYQGQGASIAPRLAPNPPPFEAFARELRRPRDRMPIYTAKVTSERDLMDMYAYLQSIPKAKTVAEIPLLSQ
jgi:ubiquinol-cytochrome c reductase cytochrome c subunit